MASGGDRTFCSDPGGGCLGAARRGAAGVIKVHSPSSTPLDCINLTGVYRFNGFLLQREAVNVPAASEQKRVQRFCLKTK